MESTISSLILSTESGKEFSQTRLKVRIYHLLFQILKFLTIEKISLLAESMISQQISFLVLQQLPSKLKELLKKMVEEEAFGMICVMLKGESRMGIMEMLLTTSITNTNKTST